NVPTTRSLGSPKPCRHRHLGCFWHIAPASKADSRSLPNLGVLRRQHENRRRCRSSARPRRGDEPLISTDGSSEYLESSTTIVLVHQDTSLMFGLFGRHVGERSGNELERFGRLPFAQKPRSYTEGH